MWIAQGVCIYIIFDFINSVISIAVHACSLGEPKLTISHTYMLLWIVAVHAIALFEFVCIFM